MKFVALIPFAHGINIYNPSDLGLHEIEDTALLQVWTDAGLIKLVEDGDKAPIEGSIDYELLSYSDLKEHAKNAGIKSYNSMKKDKLIEALKEV